jgi:hypothetical protein|uniref:DUF2905 domain-containing protein n=1 Tax=Desulfobacca acetoxidans TaxID=60893 RepID=A0A7C3Z0D4_9BACT
MSDLGKMLIILGVIIAVVGLILLAAPKIPWLGKLPGDFVYRGERFTFYFPLATSILLSIILSLILYLFRK